MIARRGTIELDTTRIAIIASKPSASWTAEERQTAHDAVRYVLEWWSQRAQAQRGTKQRRRERGRHREAQRTTSSRGSSTGWRDQADD